MTLTIPNVIAEIQKRHNIQTQFILGSPRNDSKPLEKNESILTKFKKEKIKLLGKRRKNKEHKLKRSENGKIWNTHRHSCKGIAKAFIGDKNAPHLRTNMYLCEGDLRVVFKALLKKVWQRYSPR